VSLVPHAPVDVFTQLEAARFGVYVHFPYCLSKCPYCDFASIVAKEVPEERYAKAILQELRLRAQSNPALRELPVDSIFIGGGTPSLWDARYVGRVLDALAGTLKLSPTAEITLEANPGASDVSRFADFRRAGVNRLSMGVQSFQTSTLSALGRAHDAQQAIQAFGAAREAGFQNVSMDFIYGVHGQTLEQVEADARQAVALGPDHLSAYALTLDKESLAEEVPLAKQLARGEVTLPSDDSVVQMNQAVREIYGAAGLERYETSNYARPGLHSRHNALYWTGGEYLALGAGATGFLLSAQGGDRYQNPRSAEVYLAAVEKEELPNPLPETLNRQALFHERLAMGLRLHNGIDVAKVCELFREDPAPRLRKLEQWVKDGFVEKVAERFRLTPTGANLHSEISARLM
jgi:putative oxygen-independent coproporphyrinogen III oxidase